MRKIMIALALLLFGSIPTSAQGISSALLWGCNQSKQFSGAAATTVLVTSVPAKQTYVCGYVFSGTATGTVQLIQGATGGTCPAPTPVTPAFSVGTASNPGIVDHMEVYTGLPPVITGNDLCVVNTAAAQVIVYYTQF